MYLIKAKLLKSDSSSLFHNNDVLLFEATKGSQNEGVAYSLTLQEASSKTGFPLHYAIPMANYIMNKGLQINDGKLELSPNTPMIDLNESATKI
jgi:hypothetical protein